MGFKKAKDLGDDLENELDLIKFGDNTEQVENSEILNFFKKIRYK